MIIESRLVKYTGSECIAMYIRICLFIKNGTESDFKMGVR